MSKYFMISSLARSALPSISRAFGLTRLAGLLGLVALLAACGGGGGGGGSTNPPPSVTLSSIVVTPASASVVAGSTLQFTATGRYSDGTTKDLTSTANWTSSDAGKATVVAASGLATGVAAGSATITATSGSISGTDLLTVTAPPASLSSISVTPAGASVAAGLTLQLTATGSYSDGTTKDLTANVTWASSDVSKATIAASGIATGLAPGSTTITATSGSISGTNTLTVGSPNLVKVELSPNKPNVPAHKVLQFSAIGTYTDHSTQNLTTSVTWSSANPAVAAVNATTGVVTAGTIGTTQINAQLNTPVVGVTINSVTINVTATVYAYATNYDSDTVSQYQISADGSLTPLTAPTIATDHQPFSISAEPSGEYVYVSNWGSSSVNQYRIGADGTLSVIGTGKVNTGQGPNAVTIDPSNRHAYVANLGENTISQYTIGLDGQLAPMASPKVTAGSNPAIVVISPDGKYAYAGNFGAYSNIPPAGPSTISQYSVDATDGSLKALTGAAAVSGSGPTAITIDPTSHYLYVANIGDDNIGQYIINSDGTLSPMTVPTVVSGSQPGGHPVDIAIDPTGKYVYVANQGDGSISQYTVGNDGSLTAMATPFVLTGGTATSSVNVDPTGHFVYATNRGGTTVSQFEIDTGGALVALTIPTVQAGTHPTAIATGY
jgi:6-phosphogluconolactonase (cycloisomerase 2 family)